MNKQTASHDKPGLSVADALAVIRDSILNTAFRLRLIAPFVIAYISALGLMVLMSLYAVSNIGIALLAMIIGAIAYLVLPLVCWHFFSFDHGSATSTRGTPVATLWRRAWSLHGSVRSAKSVCICIGLFFVIFTITSLLSYPLSTALALIIPDTGGGGMNTRMVITISQKSISIHARNALVFIPIAVLVTAYCLPLYHGLLTGHMPRRAIAGLWSIMKRHIGFNLLTAGILVAILTMNQKMLFGLNHNQRNFLDFVPDGSPKWLTHVEFYTNVSLHMLIGIFSLGICLNLLNLAAERIALREMSG